MDEPILQIAQKQYTGESSVISLRLPRDMLADIDQAARVSGRTRNEILTMGLEFAIKHMVITPAQKSDALSEFSEKTREQK